MYPLYIQPSGILGVEQDGTQVRVGRIENLEPRELVPPALAIAVDDAITKDPDVLAAPFPKHDTVLERMTERLGLPVRRVVGELDLAI